MRADNPIRLGYLRAIDLFAGSGGLSLGLQQARFEVQGVEFDALAAEAHRRGAGACLTEDVRAYHPQGNFDLVAGGFPCQIYSKARQDRGIEDASKRLWPEVIRVAQEARARALLMENVGGLMTTRTENGSSVVQSILLACRAAGFMMQTALLDAADYGVPQHRRRLFFVGFRSQADAERFLWPVPTHDEDTYVTVADVLPAVDYPWPSPTVVASEYKSWQGYCDPNKETSGKPRRATEIICRFLGQPWLPDPKDMALLQGYPPNYPFQGNREEQLRQVGNSVPPPLAFAVASEIHRVLVGR